MISPVLWRQLIRFCGKYVRPLCLVSAAFVTLAAAPQGPEPALAADLDRIFNDPVLARALMGVRVESLRTGQLLFQRDSGKLVVPASNMKIVTMAVAAERLGWNFTYETKLETTGVNRDGVLHGDLVVTGSGDPSIGSHDSGPAMLFDEWADALTKAGIGRVDGRIVGDDGAFDDDGIGPGWAWDYLADGYAARSSALSYNENVAVVRLTPGAAPKSPVEIELTPPGHGLAVTNQVTTGEPRSATSVDFYRLPGSDAVTIRGSVPAGATTVIRTTSVDNPTKFFVEGFRLALASRGIAVTSGAWDLDDVATPPSGPRKLIARHVSPPLGELAGDFLKVSQNFYGEMFLKTIGKAATGTGSTESGRQAVRETMAQWKIPPDALVMYDGSGLSRYNYVTADTIVAILKHVWETEALRGPFLAALPVGGKDGTLENRMKNSVLDGRVQAKTGTISNVRSLSGFVETKSGERIVFSMIANHFTAPSAQIDAIAERALARIVER